jgi:hypothetical protein
MTKRGKFLDDLQECLDFESPLEAYRQLRDELVREISPSDPPPDAVRDGGCCNAVAVKKAIRESGLSRDHVVDKVNEFFGWPPAGDGRERLTIHMLNNYLCRPDTYNMPIPYLHAIIRVTGSLEPLKALADMEGVKIITDGESKLLALGKIEAGLMEFQRLKKHIRGGSRSQ